MAEGAQDALVFELGSFVAQASALPMVAGGPTDHLGGIDRATRSRRPDSLIRERLALPDPHAYRHDYDGHSHACWRQSHGTEARNDRGNRLAGREGASRGPRNTQ